MNSFPDDPKSRRTTDPFSSKFGCRACEDFKTWSAKQSSAFHSGIKKTRSDCPFDSEKLGKSTWGLLHTISVAYPEHPTDKQKQEMTSFFEILSKMYPCESCARDFAADLAKNPIDASSGKSFALWLCNLHNRVNVKLGKPVFDCSKVYERWRDGWLDGSCD